MSEENIEQSPEEVSENILPEQIIISAELSIRHQKSQNQE